MRVSNVDGKAQLNPEDGGTGSGGYLTVSVTGIAAYETCPRLYYYTHVVPLRPPNQQTLARGTNIHGLIRDALRGKAVPSADEVEPWARPYLTNFLESRFHRQTPLYIEKPFRLDLPYGSIRGRMDTVYEHIEARERLIEIVDYKSGHSRTEEDSAGRLQGKLYALAANQLWNVEQVTWSYFYLGSGEIHSFLLDEHAIADAHARAERALTGIANSAWDPQPGCSCWVCGLSDRELGRAEEYWRRRRERERVNRG